MPQLAASAGTVGELNDGKFALGVGTGGNPTAFAKLRPGETVVDLGCGGGLDVLLAAPKVGPTGKAIGIDMTPDVARAKVLRRDQPLLRIAAA